VIEPAARAGWFRPAVVREAPALDVDPRLLERLQRLTGLSSSASDALDGLGLRMAVPASTIAPVGRAATTGAVIGPAITLRYLPLRAGSAGNEPNGRLAYGTLADLARPGDVMVISAPPGLSASVLGGNALKAAKSAGVAAAIADAAVRDVDEVDIVGLPVWASAITNITGRGRLEAVEINGPVLVGGVHVVAGDVAIADRSGIAFVPGELFETVAARLLEGS
jgi:regulator of RNase E activity RraA